MIHLILLYLYKCYLYIHGYFNRVLLRVYSPLYLLWMEILLLCLSGMQIRLIAGALSNQKTVDPICNATSNFTNELTEWISIWYQHFPLLRSAKELDELKSKEFEYNYRITCSSNNKCMNSLMFWVYHLTFCCKIARYVSIWLAHI